MFYDRYSSNETISIEELELEWGSSISILFHCFFNKYIINQIRKQR